MEIRPERNVQADVMVQLLILVERLIMQRRMSDHNIPPYKRNSVGQSETLALCMISSFPTPELTSLVGIISHPGVEVPSFGYLTRKGSIDAGPSTLFFANSTARRSQIESARCRACLQCSEPGVQKNK